MAHAELITGIDIGTSKIRIAVGEVSPDTGEVAIIGLSEGESRGVSKGTIRSIEEVVLSIIAVKTRAEKMVGATLSSAVAAISGSHITAQETKGVVAIGRADGEIREDDVERVLEAAQAVSVPPNYEIIHVLPRRFSIDNQTDIKDPIGMNGVRLEVEAQIIEGQTSHIKNLTKAVGLAGFAIDDLVLSSLASAEATLSDRQKDLGAALVNIGAATTSILVFEEGDIMLVRVLPVGASHITNDIAIGLRTNIDIAEAIKVQYGATLSGLGRSTDEIQLANLDEREEGSFSRKYLAEIIEARVEEIFSMVDKELRSVGRSGKLPAGVILSGAAAELPGLIEVAKRVFRLPAGIGVPSGVRSAIDKLASPAYTTACGLVLWGHANLEPSGRPFGSGGMQGWSGLRLISEQVRSMVRIFKS
ncbi:MAG: cell division protein FtsA [Parcubacteria group bacterium]|nr:cell division protein FtsA [Parcubacteria group bacterium]